MMSAVSGAEICRAAAVGVVARTEEVGVEG